MFTDKNLLRYIVKFLLCFCILYYGTKAIIGLSSPENYYSPFVHNYLDYVAWLRYALLYCSKILATIFGYKAFVEDAYTVRILNGVGVHLVYSCIGFGVMSFWAAFIFANNISWSKKLKWIVGGLLIIFFINVIRITLLLISVNANWSSFLDINHHTLFNIASYIAIFIMIYFFDKSEKNNHNNPIESS